MGWDYCDWMRLDCDRQALQVVDFQWPNYDESASRPVRGRAYRYRSSVASGILHRIDARRECAVHVALGFEWSETARKRGVAVSSLPVAL